MPKFPKGVHVGPLKNDMEWCDETAYLIACGANEMNCEFLKHIAKNIDEEDDTQRTLLTKSSNPSLLYYQRQPKLTKVALAQGSRGEILLH